jgi:cyclopropane-fatty-acyl-phospholipid synthase
MHARVAPTRHAFRYPVLFYSFDLDELAKLNKMGLFAGYNRAGLISLRDEDHLDNRAGSIREKMMRYLREAGCDDGIAKVTLVTSPRYFGRVFNPVSFYFCHRADGSMRCAVAEVNNTFGERHVYVLTNPETKNGMIHFAAKKDFHVSPFNNMDGNYEFAFSESPDEADFRIDLVRDGEVILKTQMKGVASPLTSRSLVRTILSHPVGPLLTVARIHWQAAKLFFGKKMKFFSKPEPRSGITMKTASPSLTDRMSMKLVFKILSRMTKGCLKIRLPDGAEVSFGDATSGPTAEVSVKSYRMFRRLVMDGDIGMGESFTAGDWETADLAGLIRLFIMNWHVVDEDTRTARVGRFFNRIGHVLRKNTITGSRKNIAAHYDLSNDMFKLFLDESMMYSCAVYNDKSEALCDAQKNKIRMLIKKADIRPEHHVLEIGCGWGAFAIEAARESGCRVTAITISQQQFDLATQRVKAAGLEDKISVELCDYRMIKGQFDRIVSIEMIEAVGHEHLAEFFAVCDRALKPGGKVVIQAITIPHERYETYRNDVDWIRKHIFPGGHLPSLEAMRDAMASVSKLEICRVENIGLHYAQTLRDWRGSFTKACDKVFAMGFDGNFVRKWIYYFALCEASFETRAIDTLHLVISREREVPA